MAPTYPTTYLPTCLPTLTLLQAVKASEPVLQQAQQLVVGAWEGLTTPFAIFGDRWLLNVLFVFTVGLLSFSLVFQAPKQ